jgi:hypothetical protein
MRFNRGVLVGMTIAAVIFIGIYLGATAASGDVKAGNAIVAIVGGLICAAVAAVIGGVAAGRANR